MKKFFSTVVAVVITSAILVGCASPAAGNGSDSQSGGNSSTESGSEETTQAGGGIAVEDIKVGIVYIGDENEGYTESHMKGIQAMKEALGLRDDQIIERTSISDDESSRDAFLDLADQGANIIFGNSFGYETYMMEVAREFPEITFAHATGFRAATSGLDNFHNYFTRIFEARYVAGVTAGLKIQEMIDNGDITEDQAKMAYVGAFPYAEVISGYSAFFLGAKSIVPSVTMEVRFTNSWGAMDLEKEAAQAMIADGAILVSQHSDTTGPAAAAEEAGVPVVGYNISVIAAAPDEALVSSTNNWAVYYTFAVQSIIDGTPLPVNWAKGFAEDAVALTELNEGVVAPGTDEKIAEVIAAIKAGTLHVFDTSTFTVDGETVTTFEDAQGNELISDGYFHESEFNSAPSFDLAIDGITAITN